MVKNNQRGKLSDLEKMQRMIAVSELYYERSLGGKKIAEELGCSITEVGRILKRALEANIIELRINRRHLEKTRQDLMELFGLQDVRLSHHVPDVERTRKFLAEEAARYFDEVVSHDHPAVGISGGRTMHQMVEMIKPQPRRINIYP